MLRRVLRTNALNSTEHCNHADRDVLLTSKVDRLSRDVEFVARLCKDKKLNIKVAQIPNADHFQIHLFAALAQAEREFISSRTKAALAAAKERGVVLGNPNLSKLNQQRSHRAKKAFRPLFPPHSSSKG